MEQLQNQRAPWHFWLVGFLGLLWNAFGAFDYLMTQTRNDAYLAAFTLEQRAYFENFPGWIEAFWAIGVWGAVAGSIALLLRSRHAVLLFAASLLGLFLTTVWQFLLADVKPFDIMPKEAAYITGVIWVVAIGLFYYAWKQAASGHLR